MYITGVLEVLKTILEVEVVWLVEMVVAVVVSLQQQQLCSEEEDDIHEREEQHFIVQKKILSQRCNLYIKRQNNIKQIREYMQGFLTRVKQGNVSYLH